MVVRHRQPHRPRRHPLRRPVDPLPPGHRPRRRRPRLGRARQIWMAHAAATSATAHRFAETFARGGIGQAGVTLAPFRAWIDDWRMTATGAPGDTLAAPPPPGRRRRLRLRPRPSPPTARRSRRATRGFSVKSERGQASYYYSQPFYTVTGTLTLDGARHPRHRPRLARPRMVERSRSTAGPGGLGLVRPAPRRRRPA